MMTKQCFCGKNYLTFGRIERRTGDACDDCILNKNKK